MNRFTTEFKNSNTGMLVKSPVTFWDSFTSFSIRENNPNQAISTS